MPEILPSGATPYEVRTRRTTVPKSGSVTTKVYDGTVASIEALESQIAAGATVTGNIASLEFEGARGRATLAVNYRRLGLDLAPGHDDAIQELYGSDHLVDILQAPYFATLTPAEILEVYDAIDQGAGQDPNATWSAKQKQLYGHRIRKQEQFIETRYELRQTWRTASTQQLKIASANPNTVQKPPKLGAVLFALIDALPDGEWLKKPTVVASAGKAGWTVTVVYQWAPSISILYGGTFTGL